MPTRLTRLARVHGVVGLVTCLCLILLYLNVEIFGPVNDQETEERPNTAYCKS